MYKILYQSVLAAAPSPIDPMFQLRPLACPNISGALPGLAMFLARRSSASALYQENSYVLAASFATRAKVIASTNLGTWTGFEMAKLVE
ncbi:MAG: hypothetical protein IPI77_16465 [Saprospiraceae bacterium]|nr:hypothetical protein [Saprospiraceae bacterium]